MFILEFLTWLLLLYMVHRTAHVVSWLRKWHLDHHAFIGRDGYKSRWEWNNLLLFNDTRASTIDLWLTEVLPTVFFSVVTGAWWITIFYYVWASSLQEILEHHPHINFYPLTFGDWHLIHHRHMNHNYGLFLPVWDKLFGTEYART